MEARSVLFRAAAVCSVNDRLARRLAGALAVVMVTGLVLASLTLISRRAAGSLAIPLPAAALAATGVVAAVAAAASRWLAFDAESSIKLTAARRWMVFIPTVAKIALAAAVSLPNSSPVGLTMLWIAVTAEEVWFWRRSRRLHGLPNIERFRLPTPRSGRVREDRVEPQKPHSATTLPPPSNDVVQRLIRTRSAAGIDRIEGWLKATAQPGERTFSLHVAFCPPFERVPQFTAIQSSGPPARVRPVQLLPYGIRLEVKLSEPRGDRSAIVVEFSAESESTVAVPSPQPPVPSP